MSINLFRNRSISSDRQKHYRLGSAVMMAAISAAVIRDSLPKLNQIMLLS